jgi:hypothetical protein
LAIADPNDPKTVLGVTSANLTYYSSVWSYAKGCRSVIGLGKRFYWVPGQEMSFINGKVNTKGVKHKSNSVLVDIVAKNGLEWIKVSSSTEKRIIWDLTKSGWAGDSDNESDYGSGNESSDDDDDDDDDDEQGLLKKAEALVKASRATRVRYHHPTVRLVLPKISSTPDSKEVANILQQIRNLGVVVQTADDLPANLFPATEVIPKMTAVRFEPFSDTMNVDCTILLAFVSDLSHGRVEPEDWHNKTLAKQIEMEVTELLLPNSLWPTCGSRKLVCTREAALRMRDIVDIIGTATEKQRTSLLFNTTLPKDELLSQYQALSDYPIPSAWSLPIDIKDDDMTAIMAALPPIAKKALDSLTRINQSVFGYGWANGLTTISSNGIVAKQIEWTIEENRAGDEVGPDVWLSAASRSLVGKEKERRGGEQKVKTFKEKKLKQREGQNISDAST